MPAAHPPLTRRTPAAHPPLTRRTTAAQPPHNRRTGGAHGHDLPGTLGCIPTHSLTERGTVVA
jgi:hypothetical protein